MKDKVDVLVHDDFSDANRVQWVETLYKCKDSVLNYSKKINVI